MYSSPDGFSKDAVLAGPSCTVDSGPLPARVAFVLVSLLLGLGCASDSESESEDPDANPLQSRDADQNGKGSRDAAAAIDSAAFDVSAAGSGGSSPAQDSSVDAVDNTDTSAGDKGLDANQPADSTLDAEEETSIDSTVDADQDEEDAALDSAEIDVSIQDAEETKDARPACDDDNPDTEDFIHSIYGCGHKWDYDTQDDEAWIEFDSGLSVDVATGMGWSPIVFDKTWDYFADHCDDLSLAGLENWSFATISDLRTLSAGCEANEPDGSCPLQDPSCLDLACGTGADCSPCIGGGGPKDGEYCKVDVASCTNLWSASICGDCADGDTVWVYVSSNGYFSRRAPDFAFHGRCVVEDVPNL